MQFFIYQKRHVFVQVFKYQSICIDMQCIGVWSFWAQENNEMVPSVEDSKKAGKIYFMQKLIFVAKGSQHKLQCS